MGQENRVDLAMVHAHLAQVAGGGIAGIKDQDLTARHHQGAGAGAFVVRERRARTAQADMQAVAQFSFQFGGQPLGHHFLGHPHTQAGLKSPSHHGHRHQDQQGVNESART